MKLSATLFAIVAFSATVFAAPTGEPIALAEREGELCCAGLGTFYVPPVEEAAAVEERAVEEVVEAEVEERDGELCCAGLGTFYVPPVDKAVEERVVEAGEA